MREDEQVVVQIAPNHLVINLLTPYTAWEEYLEIIDFIKEKYRMVANPAGVERVILQYKNEIKLTDELRDKHNNIKIDKLFDVYPFWGNGLPQSSESFILGVKLPFHNREDILRLQMEEYEQAVSLDLTYFANNKKLEGDFEYTDWLHLAHQHIIETFESCIKDPLRQKFGGEG